MENGFIQKDGSPIKEFVSSHRIYLILVPAAIVFLNSLRNGFVCDDWVLMVYNKVYRSFDIGKILFSMANSLEYLPVRDITLAVDAQIWGMKPFGFHLTNLVLYLVSLIVLFKMTRNLSALFGEKGGDFIAFWTTLIFALHPLHAEAVNFIAARNNILAALFLFLSLNLFIDGIRKKNDLSIVLSAIVFVCALFSKASVIFYPFFLAALLLLIPRKTASLSKKSAILLLFLIIDGAAFWFHFRIASETTVMNEHIFRYGSHNIALLLKRALYITFFYLKKLFVPYPLSTDYPISFEKAGPLLVSSFIILLILIMIGVARAWKKGYLIPVVGAIWFFLSLGPVLNFFPTSPVVADRYAYLAVFGFGLVLSYVLKIGVTAKKEFSYIAFGIVALWGSLCFFRNMDWRSDATILEAAISVNPAMDRSNLANALWNAGEYEKALTYLKAERERTGTYNYNLFLGRYLFLSGKYPEAVVAYQKALSEGAVALKEAHLYIAEAYEKTGSDLPALSHYLRVFSAKSLDPLNEYTRKAQDGVGRIRSHLAPKLEELRNKALNEPQKPKSHSDLAAFLYELGMYEEAEKSYQTSLNLSPSAWDMWYNLGNVYMKMDKYEDAIGAFERSLRVRSNNVGAIGNIGICYAAMHNYQKAIEYYERVIDLDSNNLYAAFNLGKLYFNSGDTEKAQKYLSLARSLTEGNKALQTSIDHFLGQLRQ